MNEPVTSMIVEPARSYLISAWLVTAALLWLTLRFDLLPALLAGLLVFELVHLQTKRLPFDPLSALPQSWKARGSLIWSA